MNELPKHPNLYPFEIAKFLRVSLSTVYSMIQRGLMPATKIGHQWRIPRDKFCEWYDKQQATQDSGF